jgi:hypothetical protein
VRQHRLSLGLKARKISTAAEHLYSHQQQADTQRRKIDHSG